MKRLFALLICIILVTVACACNPDGEDTASSSSSAPSEITFNDGTANPNDLPHVDVGDLEIG